jgi:ethanolamine ammonia-lyase large subunit
VVGFIGPEYLYDGKQIIRAGLEDHFCGKLMGLPIGCDVCYTNHAEADQDDMDTLLTLLCAAGLTFLIGVPGRTISCSITRAPRSMTRCTPVACWA